MTRGSEVPRDRIARVFGLLGRRRLGSDRVERVLHDLGDGGVGLRVTREDRLDGEAVELQNLSVLAGHGADLRRRHRLAQELFGGDRGADHQRSRPHGDRGRIGHVVEMTVADDDHVRPLHVVGGEAERRIVAAAVDEGIEQDDLVAIGELEIGKAGPSHRERVRIVRRRPAGRHERWQPSMRNRAGQRRNPDRLRRRRCVRRVGR